MDLHGRRIHFMGAGGIGVSALAELTWRAGARVTACDLHANDRTAHLRRLGIPVSEGHDPRHLDEVDLLVYTSAVPPDHPERSAAPGRCEAMRRGTFLARFLRGRRVAGVSGAHGKTTTTWLLGQLLVHCGMDPTVILGGVPVGEASNVRQGESDLAVVELDESDESFLEPDLTVAVVTAVEPDHLDHYATAEAVEQAYRRFAQGVAPHGVLVCAVDDPGAWALWRAHAGSKLATGLGPEAELRGAERTAEGMSQTFTALDRQEPVGRFALHLPGTHNAKNALTALGAARALGAPWDALREALPRCVGVARRFELIGARSGVTVVEDYAHHPTEVRAALATARTVHPGRVVALFQPHLYSRTLLLGEALGAALATADAVVVAHVYPAREAPIPGANAGLVVDAVRQRNGSVAGPVPRDHAAAAVLERVRPGDLVLVLGAGDIGDCARELLERL